MYSVYVWPFSHCLLTHHMQISWGFIFLEGGCCYTRSLSWLKIVPTELCSAWQHLLKPWCSCWCECVVTQPKPRWTATLWSTDIFSQSALAYRHTCFDKLAWTKLRGPCVFQKQGSATLDLCSLKHKSDYTVCWGNRSGDCCITLHKKEQKKKPLCQGGNGIQWEWR